MNWENPPPGFQYILFERIEPELNVARYYYLAYVPTLLGPAVVRLWGRKGRSQRVATPKPFASLEEAWPELRKHIRTRLRRGYCIKEPAAYRVEGDNGTKETILKSKQQQLNEAGRQQWNQKVAFWDALHGAEGNDFHRYLISPTVDRAGRTGDDGRFQ